MRKYLGALLLVVCVFFGTLVLEVRAQNVIMTVYSDKTSYFIGETAYLTAVLTNISPYPVTICMGCMPGHYFRISRGGMTIWRFPEYCLMIVWDLTLGPGEQQTYTAVWDLTDFNGNPVPPDLYQVEAAMYVCSPIFIQSFPLTISVDPTPTLDVLLTKGWNMISWPGEPVPSNVNDIVAGNPDVLSYFYTWDSGIGGYVTVSEVKCGDGYWVAATQDCLLEICYVPVYQLIRELAKGWNMTGSVACAVPVSSLTSSPSYHLPYVYTWDCSIGGYELVDDILPTVGHWIAATEICDLTMSCSASPLVESQPSVDVIAPTWKSTVSVGGQELAFGMHPSATEGFDSMLDKPLPPFPEASDDVKKRGGKKLSGIVKAGWVIADSTFRMLSDSYVKESTQGVWELSVELPKPGKIEWSDLPEGYRCILQYGKRSVDMNSKEFLPLPAGEYNLTLVLDALSSLPRKTEVLANYPNPFNPETWIPYRLAEDGHVTLIIRDVSGREVRRFHLGRQLAGEYVGKERAIYWDGRNESGELVSSGVYFYTIQTGRFTQTGKLVIVR